MGAALLVLAIQPVSARAASFADTIPTDSDAGYFMLEWQADGPVSIDMTRPGPDGGTSEIYHGHNHALFLTGLRDGQYELQLKGTAGQVADSLTLHVEHQSLNRALWLVALGAIAFLATVAVVLRGARNE